MKRLIVLCLAVLWFAGMASPAYAQGPSRSDSSCFGGNATVAPNESPDNLILFGCGARVSSGARVGRDVVAFGSNIVLEEGARVGRDIVVFGGNVNLAGQVGRRITIFGGSLTLESGSEVKDDVTIFGGGVDRKPGAVVHGRIVQGGVFSPGRERVPFTFPFVAPWTSLWFNGYSFWSGLVEGFVRSLITTLGLAALGVLILVFLPTQTNQVATTAERAALPSVGVGCLTLLVGGLLTLLLIVTCLGIPLALLLIVLLAAANVFGWVAVSSVLGERLLRGLRTTTIVPIVAMLVGVFVLWLVTQIPVLGGLISLFVASLGLGAVVLTRFGTQIYPPTAGLAIVPAPPTPPTSPSVTSAPVPPAPPAAPTPPPPPAPPAPQASGQDEVSI